MDRIRISMSDSPAFHSLKLSRNDFKEVNRISGQYIKTSGQEFKTDLLSVLDKYITKQAKKRTKNVNDFKDYIQDLRLGILENLDKVKQNRKSPAARFENIINKNMPQKSIFHQSPAGDVVRLNSLSEKELKTLTVENEALSKLE